MHKDYKKFMATLEETGLALDRALGIKSKTEVVQLLMTHGRRPGGPLSGKQNAKRK
jgi:hypothetical protein